LPYQVGGSNEKDVEAGVLDPSGHVLSLYFLEVELGEDVKPVRDLGNKTFKLKPCNIGHG